MAKIRMTLPPARLHWLLACPALVRLLGCLLATSITNTSKAISLFSLPCSIKIIFKDGRSVLIKSGADLSIRIQIAHTSHFHTLLRRHFQPNYPLWYRGCFALRFLCCNCHLHIYRSDWIIGDHNRLFFGRYSSINRKCRETCDWNERRWRSVEQAIISLSGNLAFAPSLSGTAPNASTNPWSEVVSLSVLCANSACDLPVQINPV